MKPRFHSFLSGFLAGVLVVGVSLSALAITSGMTIDVYPINIQVNGETFQPTDVTGKEVPVFAYQGTTYAPLRALAEAYGLEVGYDAEANMASVNDPDVKPAATPAPDTTAKTDYDHWSAEDEAAYQEFKGMWEDPTVRFLVDPKVGEYVSINFQYLKHDQDVDTITDMWITKRWNEFAERYAVETFVLNKNSLSNGLVYYGSSANICRIVFRDNIIVDGSTPY